MGLKHFIYTGNFKGEDLIGSTPGVPERISSTYENIFATYQKTSVIDSLLAQDRNLNIDDYCPVRKKYSKVYGGNYFLRMNYLGFEVLSTGRLNNTFMHGGFTTDEVTLPFAYFDVDFFKSRLSNDMINMSHASFPEETIPSYDYNQLIKSVSEFTKDEQNLVKLSNYLPLVIKAIDTNNSHLCFSKCGNGKGLWNFIRCFSMILPSDYVQNCTFDTHICPETYESIQSVVHLSLNEKIIGIYNSATQNLKTPIGHTLQWVDITLDCCDFGELYEPLKYLLSGEFDEVTKKVGIYRSVIDFCQGSCIEKIKTAISLVKTACLLNRELLEKDYIDLMKVILTSDKFPKESVVLDNLLSNSVTTDINITCSLIDDISSYPSVKKALGISLANLLSKPDSVNAISDSVFACEECGINLIKLLYSFDNLKGKLSVILNKNIDSHIEKFLKGDSNAKSLHAFLLTYIGEYKKSFNNLVRENYNKNKQSFIDGILSENCDETVASLNLYSDYCSNVSVDDLFKIAFDKTLSNDKAAFEILQGNTVFFKILNNCLEKSGDKKKDDKIEKYLKKTLYSSEFLTDKDVGVAIETLNSLGLSGIFDEYEILKSILKFKSYENNLSCLDFITNSFKNLNEAARIKRQNEISKHIQDIFIFDLNRTELDFRSLKKCFNTYPAISNDVKLKTAIKYILENGNPDDLLTEVVDFFIQSPYDSINVFNSFLENGDEKLAKTFFDSYVLKNFTYASSLYFLSKSSGDISCIVKENFAEFWKYISMGGNATAKEVISLSLKLISKVNDEVKELFLKQLIENYGLCAFDTSVIQKLSKEYKTQLPLISVLTTYAEVLKTSALSLQSFKNMMNQVAKADETFVTAVEKYFQSAVAYGCVMGTISPKIKGDIESCFDVLKFYRDMLSHFTIRNDGSISSKHILKFIDSDCIYEIKDFASKYVKDNTILSKLATSVYNYGTPGEITKKEIEYFQVAIERHTVDPANLVKMYTHFCTHSTNHNDDALLTLVLRNGNLKDLDNNTISKLMEVSKNSANNIVFHTSNLNSVISSGKVFSCVDEFINDPLKTTFAWLLAYESLTHKIDESFIKFLVESYKDEYVCALCEIITDAKNRFGKLSNLTVCYDYLTKRASTLNVSNAAKNKIGCLTKLKSVIFGK